MNSTNDVPSRWKKPIIGAGIATVVVVCGFAAGLSQTDLSEAASKFDKNKADAEKEGLFFTREQVEARYAIPESDNGAKLVQSVLPLARNLKIDRLRPFSEKIVAEHWAEIESAISKIDEASHRKSLMFKRDFRNPAATLFPEYSGVKDWVSFLVQLAHRAVEKGDVRSAEKYFELSAYLANAMDQEGLLIGLLVRIASLAIIDLEIQHTIRDHGKDPGVVKMLDQVLTKLDKPYDLKLPIQVEHWFGSAMVEPLLNDPKAYSVMGSGSGVPREIQYGKYLPRFKVANMSRIHRFYADAAHMMPTNCDDLVAVQTAFADMDKAAFRKGLSYTILDIVGPVFGATGAAVAREIAQRNTLKQAVTILNSGANPAIGLPLKGRFAMDVDGKPIRVKKTSSGWIVYSIWIDKVDDGGEEAKGAGKGDYVVHLPK